MKILLAEDDTTTGEYVLKGLTEQGYIVNWVQDGREALTACLYNEIDLAIIDRMMPGLDGLSVVKALRSAKCDISVIFLTALGEVDDRVEALLAGGDDYLTKPFHLSELLARIVVLGRRPKTTIDNTLLQVHDLTLNLLTREAQRQEQTIELAGKEFALLEILMQYSGQIITKTTLLEKVWDFNFNPGTTIIETHISNLRQKIDKPFDVALLHTVRNMGYCLRAPK
ncbi:MAG: DNA-binding response regulator [Thiothrix nivea]|nr:MAG: DNA-binding response regulator [Thiothrix nivea]